MAPRAWSRRARAGWSGRYRWRLPRSDGAKHRMPALLALHVLGAGEAADRPMLPAVGALRDELEPPQAEDADEAAGKLRGAQPGLAAARAVRALEGALIGFGRARCLPHAAVDSFSHATRVSVVRAATRFSDCLFGWWVPTQEIGRAHGVLSGWLDDVEAKRAVGRAEEESVLPRFQRALGRTIRHGTGFAHTEPIATVQLQIGPDVRRQCAHGSLQLDSPQRRPKMTLVGRDLLGIGRPVVVLLGELKRSSLQFIESV